MYSDQDNDTINFTYALINPYNIYYLANGPGLLSRGHAPLLWARTSPITVPANHSIASSVKYKGPDHANNRAKPL